MPGRDVRTLKYFQRFKAGDRKAFREFVKAREELILHWSQKRRVPKKLIIEEMFHRLTTSTDPLLAADIAHAAKIVADRKGKPRRPSRRRL